MTEHKKQHYIPAGYLKAWCDPAVPSGQTPYVWVFDFDGNNAKHKAPRNIFHETDLYTIPQADGGRDLVLERGLSQLESDFVNLRSSAISRAKRLSNDEQFLLCVFIAAMHVRTISFRDHQAEQWSQPARLIEELQRKMDLAPEEEREAIKNAFAMKPSENAMTYEQVKGISEKPLQNLLIPTIRAFAPLLMQIDLAILETNDRIGFITSDAPCVWFDPEAYKRPPFYRYPALGYESVEITFPVSPRHCVFLNRKFVSGYFKAKLDWVDEMNRRTRFAVKDSFIVNRNETKDIWFDPGEEPEDSWEKRQQKEDRSDDL